MNLRVLVIGSGIAGLHFSLKAAGRGHFVTIVTKKKIVDSATNRAQGGIAAVLDKTDDFEKHIEDTLKAGRYHNRKKAVAFMIKNGPRMVHELVEMGVPFATHHGKLVLTREGGHKARRVAFVGDYTGQEIEKTLVAKVKTEKNIKIMEHAFAVDLLVKKNICYGALVFDAKLRNLFSDITVLASGGLGQLYEHTTNPEISTGDGYAMAHRAGAKFRDMEFIQFHPTGFKMKNGRIFLLSEALRGEGARLRNARGVRFMKKIHPMAELAPRDIVSRAIFEELKNGKAYLDLRHLDEAKIHTRFPQITEMLKKNGYRVTRDLIPISPAAHYCCGGVETDLKGRTCIKNLFAFGEVAWTGVHGANRLASNSLLEALVFSDQILKSRTKKLNPPYFVKPNYKTPSSIHPKTIKQIRIRVRRALWQKAGIVRTKKELGEARKILQKLLEKILGIPQKHPRVFETRNMIETGILVTEAALKRKKSLGCHFRKN